MLISAVGLTKVYRQKKPSGFFDSLMRPEYEDTLALDRLDLSIGEGEFVGLLGRNGAGKSTLIKLICGLQSPTSGSLRVLGRDSRGLDSSMFMEVSAVFGQKTSLWWDLSLGDCFAAARHIYDLDDAAFAARRAFLIDALDLGAVLGRPVRVLSLGERVKGELAFNLLHNPRLILLDEPTIGLDLVSKARLRGFLQDLVAKERCTVLVTSHDMGDIEHCCSRICVIERGRLEFDGDRRKFAAYLTPQEELTLAPVSNPLTTEDAALLAKRLRALPGVETAEPIEETGEYKIVYASGTQSIGALMDAVHEVLGSRYTFHCRQGQADFEQAVLAKLMGGGRK